MYHAPSPSNIRYVPQAQPKDCTFEMRSVVVLSVALLVWTVPVAASGTDSLYYAQRPAMGTHVELYLYAPDPARAAVLFERAFEEVERVEATLSTYRPTSELSRLNAQAGAGPVRTDPEVFSLLARALDYSRQTDGAFDISVGQLVKAWGFFRGEGRFPAADTLAEARAQAGWQHVRLDPTDRTVRFLVPKLELDMGGIGKGYALDRVAALLRSQGVEAALLGLGSSSYYALGAPPGEAGWAIRVPEPLDRARTLSTVTLRDASLSTSGDFEKFFELNGRRYCHIFDPRTGFPVEGMLQVTVIAPRAEDSDALSTALFVLGAERAAALLHKKPNVSALLVKNEPGPGRTVSLNWPEDDESMSKRTQ